MANLKEILDQFRKVAGEKIAAREFNNLKIAPKDIWGYIQAEFEVDGLKYKGSFKPEHVFWHLTYAEASAQYDPILTEEQNRSLCEFFDSELKKQEIAFWTAEKNKAEEKLKQLEDNK